MSRASGRNRPRDPITGIVEELLGGGGGEGGESEAQLREQGATEDQREIPGGLNHIANPPVHQQKVPVPDYKWPYYRDDLAHGVEPDGNLHDRDPRLTGGQKGAVKATPVVPRQSPVPVYLVESEGGPGTIRSANPRHITVPASTSAEPARICGKNEHRVEIMLLNEDTATDIRIAQRPSDLALDAQNSVITGGALVPWPLNSYMTIKTQDELYAIGRTGAGTPLLSVIEVFELAEDN